MSSQHLAATLIAFSVLFFSLGFGIGSKYGPETTQAKRDRLFRESELAKAEKRLLAFHEEAAGQQAKEEAKPDESQCTEPAKLVLESLKLSGWEVSLSGDTLWRKTLKIVLSSENKKSYLSLDGGNASYLLTDNDLSCIYVVAAPLAKRLLAERNERERREIVEALRKAAKP